MEERNYPFIVLIKYKTEKMPKKNRDKRSSVIASQNKNIIFYFILDYR